MPKRCTHHVRNHMVPDGWINVLGGGSLKGVGVMTAAEHMGPEWRPQDVMKELLRLQSAGEVEVTQVR
jgi:hypothetical protein